MREVFNFVDSFLFGSISGPGFVTYTYQVKPNRGNLVALAFENLGTSIQDNLSIKVDTIEVLKANSGPGYLKNMGIYSGSNPDIITIYAKPNSVISITYFQSARAAPPIKVNAFYSYKRVPTYNYVDLFNLFNDGAGGTTTQEYQVKQDRGKLSKILLYHSGAQRPNEIKIYANSVLVWNSDRVIPFSGNESAKFILNGIEVNQPKVSSVNVNVNRNSGAPINFVICYVYE